MTTSKQQPKLAILIFLAALSVLPLGMVVPSLPHIADALGSNYAAVNLAIAFLIFVAIALRANRFWPLWVSAFLGLGVLGHLGRMAGPEVYWWAYAVVLTIWSYPIVALIALGTFLHRRRLALNGVDRSWSSSSARLGRTPPAGPTA